MIETQAFADGPWSAMKLASDARLQESARRLLQEAWPPGPVVDRLLAKQLEVDAIQYLAQVLSKREAVWWASMCSWLAWRPLPPQSTMHHFQAALRWVIDPSEANRQATEVPDTMEALQTSAGSLAVAVVWSGGSMVRSDLPAVPPPDYLTGRSAAHAILIAAVEHEPMKYLHHYRQFLALGLEVAQGKLLWTRPDRASVSDVSVEQPSEWLETELVSVD